MILSTARFSFNSDLKLLISILNPRFANKKNARNKPIDKKSKSLKAVIPNQLRYYSSFHVILKIVITKLTVLVAKFLYSASPSDRCFSSCSGSIISM